MNEQLLIQKTNGDKIAIKARGALNIYNAEGVKKEVLELMESYHRIAFSLEDVEEFDSAGFQVLYSLKKTALEKDCAFKLVKHSVAVLKVMDLYGAIDFFQDKIRIPIEEKKEYSFSYGTQRRNIPEIARKKKVHYPEELCNYIKKVLPVWREQIVSSKKQTEDSAVDLTDLFQSLFEKIDKAVKMTKEASVELTEINPADKTRDFSIKKFEEIQNILTASQEIMKNDVAQLKNDISEVIYYMQFSDRVGQILNQVVSNMANLSVHLDELDQTPGMDKDYESMFQDLRETYSTPEEHNIHEGKEAITHEESDVTFF